MCGKFTQLASWKQVHAFSQPLNPVVADDAVIYATPMMFAHVMRLGAGAAREMTPMRWGFADRGAKSPARPRHMHARAETIDTLPTFAGPFARSRGLLMVSTFNVGEVLASGKTRQWVVTPKDGRPLALAVIFERWENGDEALDTFVMVSAPANALIAPVTDRMPVPIAMADWPVWLGESGATPAEAKALLRTAEGDDWRIAPQVATAKASGQASLF